MKPPKLLLTVTLVASLAACAALSPGRSPEQNAELRLDRGLFALDAGRYADAFQDLAWVYSRCSGHQTGNRALLALAALELDARNPRARPAVGTELLGRLIRDPGTARWVRPLAETTFLTSLALGAPAPTHRETDHPAEAADTATEPPADTAADTVEQTVVERGPEPDVALPGIDAPTASDVPVYGCGPSVATEGWLAPSLPELPGPSMAALLAVSEAKRDSLATRADTLQQRLAAVSQQLRVTEEELERIRKTLKP